MASPRPDIAVLDPKPHEPTSAFEGREDANGHAAITKPSTELPDADAKVAEASAKAQSPQACHSETTHPVTNGNANPEDRQSPNGLKTEGGDTQAVAHSEPARASPATGRPEPSAQTEEKEAETISSPIGDVKQEPDKQPVSEPSTDTKMADATDRTATLNSPPTAEKSPGHDVPQTSQRTPPPTTDPVGEPKDKSVNESAAELANKPAAEPATISEQPKLDETDVGEKASAEQVAITSDQPTADAEMSDKPSEELIGSEPKPIDRQEPSLLDNGQPSSSDVDLHPTSMSGLAIEATETESSQVETSVDVSMSDAPSAKQAREREDDIIEEPASKRAKTESKEEELVPASGLVASEISAEPTSQREVEDLSHAADVRVEVETEPAETAETPGEAAEVVVETTEPGEPPSLSSVPHWEDAEVDARPLTLYRRREIRKSIARVKKTKSGINFKESVQKKWPHLWEAYAAQIEKPMDLSEMERILRDTESGYKTVGDVRSDLGLIFTNSLAYNGPAHDVTRSALAAVESLWGDVHEIPDEEPPKPKPAPKTKPVRESRATAHVEPNARRQSSGPAASPTGDAIEAKVQPPDNSEKADRRASTATEGDRPKRTVRAPKSKDIDYTTKPSRKKLKPELQFCEEVLSELMNSKHNDYNMWFLTAVDSEGLNIPTYYSVIKKPMDLGLVSRKLSNGEINSLKEFEKNVRLIFANCYQFNGAPDPNNPVANAAKGLEDIFNSKLKEKDAWLAKNAKSSARPPAASVESDEEEDEEGEEEEAPVPTTDPTKEVRELEAKLREESDKLTNMFTSKDPNQAMINIQQGILTMVQEALLKAKQSQNEARQKQEKSGGKKSGKASKAKASGASGRKSTGGNASQPKKSGGSKKSTKKTLSASDKDQIANAINDLEYGHLDRAIDIIKRDTGQNENNDGELELDIDQLSNEALLKLWELCKKVLPGFGKDSAAGPNSSAQVNAGASAKQAPKTAAKPKKAKPMSAQEQEARIAQLRGLRDLYKPGQEPGDVTSAAADGAQQTSAMHADQSSDESSSEEE